MRNLLTAWGGKRSSSQGTVRPIKVHFFFRNPLTPGAYSIERMFDAVIGKIPGDQFIVKRLVCPLRSKGLVRRIFLIIWAAFRQGDVNHVTGDINFIGILMSRRRTVQTIHDARSLRRLQGVSRAFYELLWLWLPLRRAQIATVVSETTRAEIVRYAGRTDIRVVPCCVPVEPTSGTFRTSRPPRILQVGTLQNKNLERVIDALEGISCVLVIIGPLSAEQSALLSRVNMRYENYVDLTDTEVLEQYRRSDIVLFASTYEGFGLPILEAQAFERPVITSDREPMRSVAGRGALLVNPEQVAEIRLAICTLLENESLRKQLVDEGKHNVRTYLPANVARQYCKIYNELR